MPPLYLRVFERLLIEANHQDAEIPYKYPGSEIATKKLIKRGERLTSIRNICEWVGWYEYGIFKKPNPKTIKEILDWLVANNMIEIYPNKNNREGTHYNIVNYNSYQSKEDEEVTVKKQLSNSEVTVTGSKQECIKNVKNDKELYISIVEYLNSKTNKNYKSTSNATKRLIDARINEKFTLDDFKKVIDIKSKQWLGGEMEQYLRPQTLFGTKFESYLNENDITRITPAKNKTKFHVEENRTDKYNADELDKMAQRKRQAYKEKMEGD